MHSILSALEKMSKDFKKRSGRIGFASLNTAVEAGLEKAGHNQAHSGTPASQPCRGNSLY